MTREYKEEQDFELYLNWLKEVILRRYHNPSSESFAYILENIPMPQTASQSLIARIIADLQLNSAEIFILLLSLLPYYVSEFLPALHAEKEKLNLQLNKSLVNDSKYPTIETALLLLSGTNITERQHHISQFCFDSKLYKEDIIEIPKPPHGEPFTRSTLVPGQVILNNLLSGTVKGPEFSHDFPATLIESPYTWDDLIIDYDTRKQLEEVKEWLDYENLCKQKNLSFGKMKRGYKCLFHGPPGTGKTLAASLIGQLTNHRVYKIDLSAVVSKYIGETEKNLAKIFDRADHGNWILFFDEADALFGKRGATKSAHDRYANQEVSYLLQRFESYEGVSILATNYKDNIDTAFYRRFHSIVTFKKPDVDERLKLWKVHLPEGFVYADDISLDEIAQNVKITGAGIYNVMRRSCMKAVLNGDMIIKGTDMYDSVKIEFAKENKTLIA